MKALVIDDSSTVRKIISNILVKLGCQCVQAANGEEALKVYSENPDVTLAMVDWNMPVMNGLEFVKRVRVTSSSEKLKLIMVTTETEFHQVSAAIEAGVDEYIMKPFTPEMVEEKLQLAGVQVDAGKDS